MSLLSTEIAEIPEAAARLGADGVAGAVSTLRALQPSLLATVARGSSDHAATCLAYACGTMSGVIPASYPPSLASIEGQVPRATGQVALAISQSGQSTDIVAAARALHDAGAALVVLTNSPDSPLGRTGGHVIDIAAGPERAVAATKSFVNSILAGMWLLAGWHGDRKLAAALERMPEALDRALGTRATALHDSLAREGRLMVLGRGASLGIASEIALKAMELTGLPAMAYSTAEVRHGPMQILRDRHPVLDLTRGVDLPDIALIDMPRQAPLHPLLDPLLDLVPAYAALEAAARDRGLDPDAPDRLKKETVTL